jgi:2-amino-4-hydroxy-6-hydroxymethyldihydropteridine diphosphokinase
VSEIVALSLGANLGESRMTIARAVKLIAASRGCRLRLVSSYWLTAPVGILDQPDFVNNAALIECDLAPARLLSRLRAIERVLGRQSREKWHEREIDIDILFFGDRVIDTPELTVPHPEIEKRAFVLLPLDEIAANFVHPVLHKTVHQLTLELPDVSGARLIESSGV